MTIRPDNIPVDQCFTEAAELRAALPLYCAAPGDLATLLASLPAAAAAFARAAGFAAKSQELLLLPGEAGLAGALLGLGSQAPVPVHTTLLMESAEAPQDAWSRTRAAAVGLI